MLKYLLKSLLLISLSLFVLNSCTPSVYSGFKRINGEAGSLFVVRPWFQAGTDHFLFNSSIDVFRNHFTGLMVIKPLPGSDYRVIFINEVGIKIFDMEFYSNGDHKVHYCLEFLNKKIFIKTLKNDISLMLNNNPGSYIKTLKDSRSGDTVLKFSDRPGVKYLLIRKNSDRAEEIIKSRGVGKKVSVKYYSSQGNEPDSVRISHFNLKLEIRLSKINENK